MNILIDSAMPYWQSFFTGLGNVETFEAGQLEQAKLSHIDALFVRSTTKVNRELLALLPNLKFVGTATAGYDHMCIDELEKREIEWTAAGGCNASAVAQYVLCALLKLAEDDDFLLSDKRIAVVGDGNVGSRVKKSLKALGAEVIVFDPPKQNANKNCSYCNFQQVLQADIICLHAALNSHLEFPSKHLFDGQALRKLTENQYLLNAGRGELIDNQALLEMKQAQPHNTVNLVLDVWENEPNIEQSLISHTRIATPHIAGHTLDGKALGTFMLYQWMCKKLLQAEKVELRQLLPEYEGVVTKDLSQQLQDPNIKNDENIQRIIKKLCFSVYDIENDDSVFRRHMAQSASFAKLRQEYPIRREFSALKIDVTNTKIKELLRNIGFIISNGSTTPR